MPRELDSRDFDALSASEKIDHVQSLWDRIADKPAEVELTDEQRKELDRRLRAHEENPGDYVSWYELRRRLASE